MNTESKSRMKILGYWGSVLACMAVLAATPSSHAGVFVDHGQSSSQLPWETSHPEIKNSVAPIVIVITIVVSATAKSILAVGKKAETLAAEL
jgi:hypothetical protein